MRRRLLIAAVPLTLVPLLGCNGDAQDDRPKATTPTAATTESGSAATGTSGSGIEPGMEIEPSRLSRMIEDGMAEVTTFRVVTETPDAEGAPAARADTGEYDYRVSPPSARTLTHLDDQEPTELIAVGDDLYFRFGDSWTKESRFADDDTDTQDVVAGLQLLIADAEKVVYHGPRTVGDARGDTYTSSFAAGKVTMRTTIVFDDQGRLGAVEATTTDEQGQTTSLGTNTFTDYGAEISIEAPDPSLIG